MGPGHDILTSPAELQLWLLSYFALSWTLLALISFLHSINYVPGPNSLPTLKVYEVCQLQEF